MLSITPLALGQAIRDKSELEFALAEWCHSPTSTATLRGHISTWDTSLVADMQELVFKAPCRSTFNENIGELPPTPSRTSSAQPPPGCQTLSTAPSPGSWNVARVTSLRNAFAYAITFDQPLDWDTSSVTDTSNLFMHAVRFNRPLDGWQVGSVTNMYWSAPTGARTPETSR